MASDKTALLWAEGPSVQNGTYTLTHKLHGFYGLKLYTVQDGNHQGKRIISLLLGLNEKTDWRGCAFWDDVQGEAFMWDLYKCRRPPGETGPVFNGYYWDKTWSPQEKQVAIWVDLAVRGHSGHWQGRGYSMEHEARCLRCNALLTEPESIKAGIGPTCKKKL